MSGYPMAQTLLPHHQLNTNTSLGIFSLRYLSNETSAPALSQVRLSQAE